MENSQKQVLVNKANQLIESIKSKGYSQKEIASLMGTTSPTLSKLKMLEYFPSNGEVMIKKLEVFNKDLEKNPNKYKNTLSLRSSSYGITTIVISLLVISLLFNAYFLWGEKKEPNVNDAFNKLFESEMQVLPYQEKPELPCYHYQRKWELDGENPYIIPLTTQDGNYYYKSMLVEFYAWCEIENSEGDKLEALEFFTNELWKDEKGRKLNIDSLRNLSLENPFGLIKIAEVSSIFSDMIKFEQNPVKKLTEPTSREGKRIARYVPNQIKQGYEKEVSLVLDKYISKLSKTNCPKVRIFGNENGFPLLYNSELIMQFECSFFEANDDGIKTTPYFKRLRKVKQ